MSKAKRRKTEYIDIEGAEQERKRETGYIYNDKQREEMLKANGITAAENAFMRGRARALGHIRNICRHTFMSMLSGRGNLKNSQT